MKAKPSKELPGVHIRDNQRLQQREWYTRGVMVMYVDAKTIDCTDYAPGQPTFGTYPDAPPATGNRQTATRSAKHRAVSTSTGSSRAA